MYICAVLTPIPAVSAQRGNRPGDDTGPARVVIVGWETFDSPQPLPVRMVASVPLEIAGTVQTEQRKNSYDRVVLAGWEENAADVRIGSYRPLMRTGSLPGLPVTTVPIVP